MNRIKRYGQLWKSFIQGSSRFNKYEIFIRILYSILLTPITLGLMRYVMALGGVEVLGSGEFFGFFKSLQGVVLFLLGFIFISSGILIELAGMIIISIGVIHQKPEPSYTEVIKSNLKKFPKLLDVGSLLLLLYLLVFIPLTGAGVTLSFLQNVRIPNFISSVIFENIKYTMIYLAVLLVMILFSVFLIFTIHFIIIGEEKVLRSIRNSILLVKNNLSIVIKDFLATALINLILVSILIGLWLLLIVFILENIPLTGTAKRIVMMAFWIIQMLGIQFSAMLFFPFEIHHLTLVFYELVEKTPKFEDLSNKTVRLKEKMKENVVDKIFHRKRTLLAILIIGIVLFSIPVGIYARDLFYPQSTVKIIGHRGGVGGIPENSLAVIKEAHKAGAEFIEIDVQRTSDNQYILNHDNSFYRVAGDRRQASQLTLAEVKSLDLGFQFPKYKGEKIPTLEEVLQWSVDKVGLYIELKGNTADKKMADDVVAMIRKMERKEDTVIMSLDYSLIKYIKNTYPDIQTGYLYFFAVGNQGSFISDQMILEEDAASDKALSTIRAANKKSIIWTVNNQESMETFLQKGIDGMITDNVELLKETIEARNKISDDEMMLRLFFKGNQR